MNNKMIRFLPRLGALGALVTRFACGGGGDTAPGSGSYQDNR